MSVYGDYCRRHRGTFVPHHPRQPEEEVERPIFDWTEFRVQEVFRRADPLNEDVEKELSEVMHQLTRL